MSLFLLLLYRAVSTAQRRTKTQHNRIKRHSVEHKTWGACALGRPWYHYDSVLLATKTFLRLFFVAPLATTTTELCQCLCKTATVVTVSTSVNFFGFAAMSTSYSRARSQPCHGGCQVSCCRGVGGWVRQYRSGHQVSHCSRGRKVTHGSALIPIGQLHVQHRDLESVRTTTEVSKNTEQNIYSM